MFITIPIHPRWIRLDSTLSSIRHDNKHEWVGTSRLKQILLMLVGFIYLLWQWQVMQRKGVQLPQHVTVECCCPNAVKESRSERVGLYRNEQGGFACLALLKIALSLHQCQRSQRWYNVYRGGTTPANREEPKSMKCDNRFNCYMLR